MVDSIATIPASPVEALKEATDSSANPSAIVTVAEITPCVPMDAIPLTRPITTTATETTPSVPIAGLPLTRPTAASATEITPTEAMGGIPLTTTIEGARKTVSDVEETHLVNTPDDLASSMTLHVQQDAFDPRLGGSTSPAAGPASGGLVMSDVYAALFPNAVEIVKTVLDDGWTSLNLRDEEKGEPDKLLNGSDEVDSASDSTSDSTSDGSESDELSDGDQVQKVANNLPRKGKWGRKSKQEARPVTEDDLESDDGGPGTSSAKTGQKRKSTAKSTSPNSSGDVAATKVPTAREPKSFKKAKTTLDPAALPPSKEDKYEGFPTFSYIGKDIKAPGALADVSHYFQPPAEPRVWPLDPEEYRFKVKPEDFVVEKDRIYARLDGWFQHRELHSETTVKSGRLHPHLHQDMDVYEMYMNTDSEDWDLLSRLLRKAIIMRERMRKHDPLFDVLRPENFGTPNYFGDIGTIKHIARDVEYDPHMLRNLFATHNVVVCAPANTVHSQTGFDADGLGEAYSRDPSVPIRAQSKCIDLFIKVFFEPNLIIIGPTDNDERVETKGKENAHDFDTSLVELVAIAEQGMKAQQSSDPRSDKVRTYPAINCLSIPIHERRPYMGGKVLE